MANITGTWLGTYWQMGKPTRFEATFIQHENMLCGNILDDGYLGEATLQGEVVGRNIKFVKSYISTTKQRASVNYNGTITEDGNSMQGRWDFFGMLGFQNWEAHRNEENLEDELRKYITVQSPKNQVVLKRKGFIEVMMAVQSAAHPYQSLKLLLLRGLTSRTG
ncbi:hypothetical protein [Pseudanabaena sp. Chao 1811]|uniref:hypothetical protein n=1 Tax=Pseudanabaena sp. Chao 1811 TaxID=2963092 RepID=UPI0022F39B90|nr:hypothetical protein [Pseudanabaena sp. Chao 1811]